MLLLVLALLPATPAIGGETLARDGLGPAGQCDVLGSLWARPNEGRFAIAFGLLAIATFVINIAKPGLKTLLCTTVILGGFAVVAAILFPSGPESIPWIQPPTLLFVGLGGWLVRVVIREVYAFFSAPTTKGLIDAIASTPAPDGDEDIKEDDQADEEAQPMYEPDELTPQGDQSDGPDVEEEHGQEH